jgi:hypothetical protein
MVLFPVSENDFDKHFPVEITFQYLTVVLCFRYNFDLNYVNLPLHLF